MNTMTRFLACLLAMGLYAATTGCDEVVPFTVTVGPVDQTSDGSETNTEEGSTDDDTNESGQEQGGTNGNGQEQDIAADLEQRLGGTRLTYLRSNSNGDVYTSFREDIDLCSSGQFQLRNVSQTSGFGFASEDVYESTGTWRIFMEGTQLMMEFETQQDTNGYVGTDAFPFQIATETDLDFSGNLYGIQQNSPICN